MMYLMPAPSQDAPSAVAAEMVSSYPEFQHLKDGEARIEFLFALDPVVRNGRQVLGEVHLPTVQGRLKGVFDWLLGKLLDGTPDFLILLDFAYWDESDARMREILVFHELCHCIQKSDKDGDPRFDEDGRPVWGLIAHTVEEFSSTVRRYGSYSEEIKEFISAAGIGDGKTKT